MQVTLKEFEAFLIESQYNPSLIKEIMLSLGKYADSRALTAVLTSSKKKDALLVNSKKTPEKKSKKS